MNSTMLQYPDEDWRNPTFTVKKVAKSSAEREVTDGGGGWLRRFLKAEKSFLLPEAL